MDQSFERDIRAQQTNPMSQSLNQVHHLPHQQHQQEQLANDNEFQFIFEDQEVDERFLQQFEILSILKGNLDPIQQYQDEVAYKNLDYKLQDHPDPQIGKLIKIQQMGVQYLHFLQEVSKKKIEINHQYSNYEKENHQKLKDFKKKQQEKIKELQRKNQHADYLVSVHEEKVRKRRLQRLNGDNKSSQFQNFTD